MSGLLTYDYTKDDEARLQLDWEGSYFYAIMPNLKLLHGISGKGEKFTLGELLFESYHASVEDGKVSNTINLTAMLIIQGDHIFERSQLTSDELAFSFSSLSTWLNVRSIESDENQLRMFNLEQSIEEGLFNPFDFPAGTFSIALLPFNNNEGELVSKPAIVLKLNNIFSYSEWYQVLKRIKDFFSFAIGSGVSVSEIILKRSDDKPREVKERDTYIRVYLTNFMFNRRKGDVFPDIMPLTYSNLRLEFPKILNQWFVLNEKHPVTIESYMEKYHKVGNRISTFLSLAASLEAFHRIEYGGSYLPKEEYHQGLYKKLIQIVKDYPGLDTSFQTSLVEGTLRYAYEFSLRKRLKFLMTDLFKFGINYFNDIVKEKKWDKIVDIRNMNTHISEGQAPYDDHSLESLTFTLIVTHLCIIMKYIGIESVSINNAISKLNSYQPFGYILRDATFPDMET